MGGGRAFKGRFARILARRATGTHKGRRYTTRNRNGTLPTR